MSAIHSLSTRCGCQAAKQVVGDITRTFIASNAVTFTPGDVCVFEGLTYAQQVVQKWYAARLSEGAEGERTREEARRRGRDGRAMADVPTSPSRPFFGDRFAADGPTAGPARASSPLAAGPSDAAAVVDGFNGDGDDLPAAQRPSPRPTFSYSRDPPGTPSAAAGAQTPLSVHQAQSGHFPHFVIHVSQPVVDRKSTFIGHAIRVTDEREVPLVIHEILSDKKVAKAAHPAMFAYRIARDVGGLAGKVIQTGKWLCGRRRPVGVARWEKETETIPGPRLFAHMGNSRADKSLDCDDDGETAAGSRLAHLLDILEVENVLVVVSRWYGGILLGADRFKHINQAARDALEVGGFLADGNGNGKEGKSRRK